MNGKQKMCLWIGIAVIVLMGLFPPWMVSDWGSPVGYNWLFTTALRAQEAMRPDVTRLCLQWVMVAVVTGGLIVTFADKKPKDDKRRIMLNNVTKTRLIIALAASSFLLPVIFWVNLLLRDSLLPFMILRQIYFYRCGWLVVLCLGGCGLILMRGWEPPSKPLKVKVLIVLLTGVALGLIWFLLAAFAYMLFYGAEW